MIKIQIYGTEIITPQSLRDSSPFMGAFPNRKPMKGKVASVAWRKGLKAFSQGEGAEQSEADEG